MDSAEIARAPADCESTARREPPMFSMLVVQSITKHSSWSEHVAVPQ
jgi:hypothetical protein